MNTFFLAFIPLFVAIDALGIVPLFLSLTDGLSIDRKRALIIKATLTALIVSVLFLVLGNGLFSFLGITTNDFRIGGGLVLLVIAITDIMTPDEDVSRRSINELSGVVPIGIPLMMGPGALTTIIAIENSHGYLFALTSIIANLLIAALMFRYSHLVIKVLGAGGTKAFAKVAALFLAAIAVMMIRIGVTNILRGS